MNDVTPEQKDAVTKSFAIVGFIAIILFAVWLAVQVVSLIPGAFSSLASIADGVYNYNPDETFMASTGESVANAGEAMTVSWSTYSAPGSYGFSYECTEGVAIAARVGGELVDLNCNSVLDLGDRDQVEIVVESEKQRFTDVRYSVHYTAAEATSVSEVTGGVITIVNAAIPTSVVLGAAAEEEEETEEETIEEEPAEEAETTPTVSTPLPEVREEVIYAIPTSDPNGDVDLAVRFIGVGILTSGNTFVRTGTIDQDQTGAFQFEVKNEGTKTSDEWTFEAELPSGIDYDSSDQDELKPNEAAIITIGFDGISTTGVESFGVTIDVDDDIRSSNDRFTSAVRITN